ncbi:MAG: hypothetical protein PHX18_04625 [Candidatus Gastranaerophilales bacterium]|nr:hypothetical protein [Candidatus Gastranaerophilales bacterium]
MGIESVNLAQGAQPIKTKDNMVQAQSFGSAAVATTADSYTPSKASAIGKGLLGGGLLVFGANFIHNMISVVKIVGTKEALKLPIVGALAMGALIPAAIGAAIGGIYKAVTSKS